MKKSAYLVSYTTLDKATHNIVLLGDSEDLRRVQAGLDLMGEMQFGQQSSLHMADIPESDNWPQDAVQKIASHKKHH